MCSSQTNYPLSEPNDFLHATKNRLLSYDLVKSYKLVFHMIQSNFLGLEIFVLPKFRYLEKKFFYDSKT